MTKKPSTEERFQEWLTAFRSGQPTCLHVFLADESDNDVRLYRLWKAADRRHQKHLRDQKALKEAQQAQKTARESREERKD
jgi:hypothetical protein